MKKIILLLLILAPFSLFCGRVVLTIKRIPLDVPSEKVAVADNSWSFQAVNTNTDKDRKSKYIIIEGLEEQRPAPQQVSLYGFAFSRKEMMLSQQSKIIFFNKDKFERELVVTRGGEMVNNSLFVKPGEKVPFSFLSAGNYKISDKNAPWSSFVVSVIQPKRMYKIKRAGLSLVLNGIIPGTYVIKIFDGAQAVYQEDFSVVGEATYSLGYIMKGNKVERSNSSVQGKRFSIVPDKNE